MTRPSWLGRVVMSRHRHPVEQASRRWTRRKILISTQVVVTAIRDALARLNLPEASEADRAPAAAPPPKRASLAANPPLPKI